jgi:RNA polymerase sigma-70 factor (ECF subfamily)
MLDLDEIKELGYRIKERDEKAFHVLYREFFARLHLYATRYVYDRQEAEDIVQEAYLSLWKGIDAYQPGQSVLTYLQVIVKNGCLTYLRHLKIKDSHQDKLIEATLFSGLDEPDAGEETRACLQRVLAILPEKGHRVLVQHVLERKKISEIALEMNVAESTVKTHLKRAMKSLRTAIHAK